jgi:hypothetical protein
MLQPPRNNIYFFDNYGNFLNVMDEYPDPERQYIMPKGESATVYEDPIVKVKVPADKPAACYLGQGTKWCTASTKGKNYFKDYNKQGPLYILIPKNPAHPGEKYQFQFETNQFKNEQNLDVDLKEMLKKFAGFFNWVKDNNTEAKRYLVFISDELINQLTKIVGTAVQIYVNELVNDMEENDDGYHEWQVDGAREFGYVDDEGNIVWDQVVNDRELGNYMQYNSHAWALVDGAKDFLKITPTQVRYTVESGDNEYTPMVGHLVAYAYSTLAGDYMNNDVSNFVLNNIRIVTREEFSKHKALLTGGYKLIGRAGDYYVFNGSRFGFRDL